MGARYWGGGVDDAVGEVGFGFHGGAGPEDGVGEGGVGSDLAIGADPGVGDGGAFGDLGGFVNLGDVVTGLESPPMPWVSR